MNKQTSVDKADARLSPWVLRAGSWTLGIAALFLHFVQASPWAQPPYSVLSGTYLWLGVLLLVLPFVSSVKLGSLLELKRDLERTRSDLEGFKTDTRHNIVVLQSQLSVNTQRTTIMQNFSQEGFVISPRTDGRDNADDTPNAGNGSYLEHIGMLHLTAEEQKLLRTLWVHQVNKVPSLEGRFTLRVGLFADSTELTVYEAARQALWFEGLIGRSSENQDFLTMYGLRYCLDNYLSFPAAMWFEEPINLENLEIVKRRIPRA